MIGAKAWRFEGVLCNVTVLRYRNFNNNTSNIHELLAIASENEEQLTTVAKSV